MSPETLPGFEPVGIKPFHWLRRALEDNEVTMTDRAAVGALMLHAPARPRYGADRPSGGDSGWDFHLSHPVLAKEMAASPKTAQRSLDHLQELGYLIKVSRGRGVGRYGARASVWRLSVPVSTGHQGPVESQSQGDTRDLLRDDREAR